VSAKRIDTKTCRRCSECIGQEHHFLPIIDQDDETDELYYPCKHCDARLVQRERETRRSARDRS
jgi:hypothetical protein